MEVPKGFFLRKLLFLFGFIFFTNLSFGQNCKNYHEVAAGETLFGISKKYSLTVTELESINPGLTAALKIGQKICLPLDAKAALTLPAAKDTSIVDLVILDGDSTKLNVEIPDSLAPKKKDMYSIALLLPFSTFRVSSDSLDERSAKLRSVSVNMYRGALMAKNAMSKNGVRASISIYDIGSSAASGVKAVEKLEANDVDLVIGPLFKDALAEVAKWVDSRNSHLVVPIKISNKVLLLSDHMSKAYPGSNSQWYYLASYAKNENPNAIIVGAFSKGKDDFSVAAAKAGYVSSGSDSLLMFDVTNGAVALNEFVKNQKAKVVVLDMNSDKKLSASVSSALTGLDVRIIGGDNYASDDKLKSESKGSSKVTGTKSLMLDYYNFDHLKWIAQYRKTFKAEPDEYSAIMHDVILFYSTGLKMFGTDLNNHLNDVECPGLIFMGFDFFKTGSESGYENAYVNVVQKMNGRWGLKNNSK
jgi:LysM repeat protein